MHMENEFLLSTNNFLPKKIKTIVLVGAFAHDKNQYSYATSFYNALVKIGFTVHPFNYRATHIPFLKTYLFSHTRPFAFLQKKLCNHALIRFVLKIKPDMLFILKGELITSKTLTKIKAQCHCHIINFYPDNPFTLWNGNSNADVLKSLPLYSCFPSWSPILAPALLCSGCSHVCSFPFAFDAALFQPLPTQDTAAENLYDVCFIGTWESEREEWLTYILQQLPQLRLAIWGNRWNFLKKTSILNAAVKGEAMYGKKMLETFRSSKIILNFIRKQNQDAHNMRTFEVCASGNFLLTQYTKQQAETFFTENKSIACFTSKQDLVEKIKFFLSNNDARKLIALQGLLQAQQYTLEKQLIHYFTHCPALTNEGENGDKSNLGANTISR